MMVQGQPGDVGRNLAGGDVARRTREWIRRATSGRWGLPDEQAGLEGVEFGPQLGGELVAEYAEPVGDLRDLRRPFLDVDGERGFDVGAGYVEAGGVDRVRGGNVPDGGVEGSLT